MPSAARVERLVVEEVRHGVLDLVRRPVEGVGAARSVQRVTDRDLVRDDEHGVVRQLQQAAERLRVPKRRVIQAFPARKGNLARVRVLPGAVGLERLALEVADVDVVEQRLLHEGDVAPGERDLCGLPRPGEARVETEVEADVRDLDAELVRL